MNVVVFGAGYAGLTAGLRLESSLPDEVDLVVVDASDYHLVRHELHRVIRWPAFADEITIPLHELFDRAEVRRDRVRSIDPDAGRATLEGGTLAYDYAAVCLGSRTNFYDLPGVEEHATALERLRHARAIRSDALDLDAGDRVVVGGAGLSGVQVAGELAELAAAEGRDVEILLAEQLSDVAPGFPESFRAAVRDELDARDVTIRAGTEISRATAEDIDLDGETIPYDQFVWTGGIRGPDALSGERPAVRSTLRLGDGTFVVGDSARVVDRDGERVPASAQSAIREGRTAATNIRRLAEHDLDRGGGDPFEPRLEPFDFDPRGWVVSVGNGAVAQFGPTVLRGRTALALKTTIGVGYLTSVGAVREAVELAREEVAGALDRRDADEEGPDDEIGLDVDADELGERVVDDDGVDDDAGADEGEEDPGDDG